MTSQLQRKLELFSIFYFNFFIFLLFIDFRLYCVIYHGTATLLFFILNVASIQ